MGFSDPSNNANQLVQEKRILLSKNAQLMWHCSCGGVSDPQRERLTQKEEESILPGLAALLRHRWPANLCPSPAVPPPGDSRDPCIWVGHMTGSWREGGWELAQVLWQLLPFPLPPAGGRGPAGHGATGQKAPLGPARRSAPRLPEHLSCLHV